MKILVINSGSSSIKYKLFDMPAEKNPVHGVIEHIAERGSKIKDHYAGLKVVLGRVKRVDLVGHRVVHGAESFKKPTLINPSVLRKIKGCSRLAPLHNPANLTGIMACKKLLPGIRQVAVFDTAFHQTLPDYAYIYGLPYEYYKRFCIRKYGFHGTSHEYVAHEAARRLGKPISRLKIITCHLGNGCSITAVERGRSIDTSMGFTPLEGLIMGTRCGDIDPALITYIMQKKRIGIPEVEDILNKKSGLIGVSGISNDMRTLEARAGKKYGRAKLAIDIFIYRIKKYIGAYTAAMSGCDCLVFTGGIGENHNRIVRAISKDVFSYMKKKPGIMVIPTNEELMIARKAYKLVK
ncbi:MAG: acetate kinase [Candidatus Omnitrophota bacterium]